MVDPTRLLLGVAVTVGITAVFLAVPVVSGKGSGQPPVALDSSATASGARGPAGSLVVMGEDGAPVPAALSGATGPGTAGPGQTAAAGAAAQGGRAAGSSPPRSAGSAARPGGPSLAPANAQPGAGGSSGTAGKPSTANNLLGASGSGSASPSATSGGTDGSSGSPSSSSPDPVPVTGLAGPTTQVLALVNDQRTGANCDALEIDSHLSEFAGAHSAAMRDEDFFALTDPHTGAALGPGPAMIDRGSSDPATVVAGWLADPTDAAALLDCSQKFVGIGTATGDGGSWWTLLLN